MPNFEIVIPTIYSLDVIRLANALPAILEAIDQHQIQKTTTVHQLDDIERDKHIQDWRAISSTVNYKLQDYLKHNIGHSQNDLINFVERVQQLCGRSEIWRLTEAHAGK